MINTLFTFNVLPFVWWINWTLFQLFICCFFCLVFFLLAHELQTLKRKTGTCCWLFRSFRALFSIFSYISIDFRCDRLCTHVIRQVKTKLETRREGAKEKKKKFEHRRWEKKNVHSSDLKWRSYVFIFLIELTYTLHWMFDFTSIICFSFSFIRFAQAYIRWFCVCVFFYFGFEFI